MNPQFVGFFMLTRYLYINNKLKVLYMRKVIRKIMKFISDILTEDKKDNKYSSKKTMGIISGVLVCIAFIGDGFHWFAINENLFSSMLIFSATMLGVSTVKAFAKPKTEGENVG